MSPIVSGSTNLTGTAQPVRIAYEGVATSYLALLNAEQTYQQALISMAEARANRYSDTGALCQALGGGWWNRPDIPKK